MSNNSRAWWARKSRPKIFESCPQAQRLCGLSIPDCIRNGIKYRAIFSLNLTPRTLKHHIIFCNFQHLKKQQTQACKSPNRFMTSAMVGRPRLSERGGQFFLIFRQRAVDVLCHTSSAAHTLPGPPNGSIQRSRRFAFFLLASLALHATIGLLLPAPTASKAPLPCDYLEVGFVPPIVTAQPPDSKKTVRHSPNRAHRQESAVQSSAQAGHAEPHQTELAGHEATVALTGSGSHKGKYNAYLAHLRSKIDALWEYPVAARQQNIAGTLTLRFAVQSDGTLGSISLLQSSEQPLLDREALRTIETAAPFKPLPQSFALARLNVLATFTYQSQAP